MGKFDDLISRLDKVKRSGFSVRARCPVHGSKGQTLSVSEKDGGYIVANCFSCGADGLALVEALGLPVSILFPEDQEYIRPAITQQMKRQNMADGLIVQMSGQAHTLEDVRTVTRSRERLKGYEVKAKEAEETAPEINHPALDHFRPKFRESLRQSPALRSELVDSHWQGVADRVRRSEAELIATQPEQPPKPRPQPKAEPTPDPTPKPSAEAWLLGL